MKRFLSLFSLVLLLLLSACLTGKSMEVIYTIQSEPPLKNYTVYLLVNDQRSPKDLVGPAARDQGLFPELRNDRFNLKINLPNGSIVTMTDQPTAQVVREAVNRRLETRKVTATTIRSAAQLTLEVNIETLKIDVVDGDLMATVGLTSKIYREPSSFAKSETLVTSNRMKLLGGAGGATVLSEALTQAVNDLDFSFINNY